MNKNLTTKPEIKAWLQEYEMEYARLVPDSEYGFMVNAASDKKI